METHITEGFARETLDPSDICLGNRYHWCLGAHISWGNIYHCNTSAACVVDMEMCGVLSFFLCFLTPLGHLLSISRCDGFAGADGNLGSAGGRGGEEREGEERGQRR